MGQNACIGDKAVWQELTDAREPTMDRRQEVVDAILHEMMAKLIASQGTALNEFGKFNARPFRERLQRRDPPLSSPPAEAALSFWAMLGSAIVALGIIHVIAIAIHAWRCGW